MLWKDAKPRGGAQETVEKGQLMKPDRAPSYKAFKSMLLAWDTALADANKVHPMGQVLTDREKAMALLWMMPEDLASDIYKHSHGDPEARENYAKVRSKVDDAVFVNTSGIIPSMKKQMVGALSESSGDGDEVCEIQKQNPDTGEMEVFTVSKR